MIPIIFITDILTFFLSRLGIALSICYICIEAIRSNNNKEDIADEAKKIVSWLNTGFNIREKNERIKVLLADYKSGNEWIVKGQNVTYVTGTILIVASFTLLGTAATLSCKSIGAFSLASIGLMVTWLLALQVTGKKKDKITFNHLKAIETALTNHFNNIPKDKTNLQYHFGIHLPQENNLPVCWRKVRYMTWAFVLLILSLSWLLLSVKVRVWLF